MIQIDPKSANIESLQKGIGEALNAHITKIGTITDFAREAGVLRQTLYRLLGGKTVGTDILLRTLRTLGRHAEIENLLRLPYETPLEKADRPRKRRISKPAPSLTNLKIAKRERDR